MKHLFTIVILLFCSLCFSQNEANIWYFGNNAGLDFNSGSPVALTDGQLSTLEGCSTISDSGGNLLFYSDGVTVWSKNHTIMVNGTGLNGHPSSTHSALIVPKPNDPNIYYIFTVDQGFNDANGIQYSEVDMTMDGGLGAITNNKNILLHSPTTEKLTAIKNFSGNGYWILSHKLNSNEFISYEITSSGINTTPIVSAVGTSVNNSEDAIGQIKISPDGSKVAVARRGDLKEVQLFDFNTSTGEVSNPITLFNPTGSVSIYGVEFSPNSEVLYASALSGRVYQFDLNAGNNTQIIDSRIVIQDDSESNYSALQLGPDSKIYITKIEGYLDVINDPDVVGLGCNYISNGVYLNGRESQLGLPPFIQSFFQIGFQANDACDGDEITFNANISQAYDFLIWDFGDGNTSTDENPTHTYVNAGDYDVSLSVTAGSESSTDTKTISVYEVPLVAPIVELRQCDDDMDGFSAFNLTQVDAEVSVNYLNEDITYYETQLDAENNENLITNDTDYINQIASNDIIWARVENNLGCYATSQINLVVSTNQIPDTFMRNFYQCDDGVNTTDGVATFDFSSVNSEIEALFPFGQQLEINYYRNEIDALLESDPINDISNYENTGYSNVHNIYVRVENELDNDCIGLGHHITLYVEPLPLVTGPVIIEQCDEGNDGIELFDTSDIENELSIGQTQNITFTYEDELGNPLPSPLPNPLEVSVPIYNILATITATGTNGNCSVQASVALSINSSVNINPVNSFIACDTDWDGQHTFDTSTLEIDLFGTPGPNTKISYIDGSGNPISSPFPNSFTTGTQTITVYIENILNPDCFASYDVDFVVHPQPLANPIENDFVCDDVSNDGYHLFTLSDYNSQILADQSPSMFEVLYFESEADAVSNVNVLPDSYLVSSASQILYAKIQNQSNTLCYDMISFQVGVNYLPTAHQPENINLCDQGNDGTESLDLTIQNAFILNGQPITDNSISYYLSMEDAETRTNPQPSNFTNTSNPQTLYARIENNNSSNCYAITSFEIRLYEQPVLSMGSIWSMCEGSDVEVFADEGYDYYNWSTGETTRVITLDTPGQYTVTATNVYADFICSTEKTITVGISDIATIISIETRDWSQSNNSISIFVDGNGDYEYSIDGINYQNDNMFSSLRADEYTVYIRDKNGCGIVSEDVYLLYYPRFFTPNGDGNNDFWQIKNSGREPFNKLYIYDRYGKLITMLQPDSFGWDGTFNSNELPSSDYWFVLERQNGKTYSGHFSLRR